MNFPPPLGGKDKLANWLNQLRAAAMASRLKAGGVGWRRHSIGPDGTTIAIEPSGAKKKEGSDTLSIGFDQTALGLAIDESTGRIFVTGGFPNATQDDFTTQIRRSGFAAVTSDFDLDPRDWFFDGLLGYPTGCVFHQGQERLFVAGSFDKVNGTASNGLMLLNDDGTIDATFTPGVFAGTGSVPSRVLINSPASKVYAAGFFSTVGGVAKDKIVRLNFAGATDAGFDSSGGSGGSFTSICLLDPTSSTSKVIAGGSFVAYKGTAVANSVVLIGNNGAIDGGFDVTKVNDGIVAGVAVSESEILIGGSFTTYDGVSRNNIARVNIDGTLDTSFTPGTGFNSDVSCVAVDDDGGIFVGGVFTAYQGTTRNRIAKLRSDGGIEQFNPDANGVVTAIAIEENGNIVIAGDFTQVSGRTRYRIARLSSDGTLLGP